MAADGISTAIPRSRWQAMDLARLLAVYAIIWLHASRLPAWEGSKALGRFAVPFFVFAAVYFVLEGLRRRPSRGLGEYTQSRLVRIYLPFLAWSGIYLAFKFLKATVLPEQANDFPGWSLLWAGSFYHLWFLPFILVVSLAAFALGKAVLGHPAAEWALATACLAGGLFWALMPTPTVGLLASERGEMVAAALPAAFWAVAFTLVYRGSLAKHLKHPAALAVAGLVLVGSIAWVWHGGSSKLAETLSGLAFMVLALGAGSLCDQSWAHRLSALGPLAYGIYLSHLLFIKGIESLVAKSGQTLSWQIDVSVFVISAALSTLLAWTLSRGAATRWLVA